MKFAAKLLINGETAKQITFFMLSVMRPWPWCQRVMLSCFFNEFHRTLQEGIQGGSLEHTVLQQG